eukprot:GILI01027216.1.p1 GENE.GILI01027216.1~~GILI01027216.1.p1  ORF type:complete len:410 (+),score=110.33 GILI01027216.1:109-1230(+)
MRGCGSLEKDVNPGDVVVTVPKDLFMTVSSAISSPLGPALRAAGSMHRDDILALHLLHEKSRGSASPWAPFIASLPSASELGQPVLWPESEMMTLLAGTSVLAFSYALRNQLESDYASVVAPFVARNRGLFPGGVSADEYKWAHCVVWSRAVDIRISNQEVRAFIPWFDMLNHLPTAKTVHAFDDSLQCMKVVAHDHFPKGTQVFNNYGAIDNSRLLRLYGFALPSNPFKGFELYVPLPEDTVMYEFKVETLEKAGLSPAMSFQLSTSELNKDLLVAIRIQVLSFSDFTEAGKASSGPISNENELSALSLLKSSFEALLGAIPSSDDADAATCSDASLSSTNARHAAIVRMSEREVLRTNLQFVQEAVQKLEQ